MADLSQPATPAEFIAAGATPEQAAALATQHNMMAGRLGSDARAAMSVAARDVPPAPPATPEYSRTSPAEATAALQQHQEAQLSRELDSVMSAPSSPLDYRFPSSPVQQTEQSLAADMELRNALHAQGFPAYIVNSIGATLASAIATRANETEAQALARIQSTRATLERWYGQDTDANLQAVDALLEPLRAKGGAVLAFIESAAYHLDALSLDSLVQFARHSSRRTA